MSPIYETVGSRSEMGGSITILATIKKKRIGETGEPCWRSYLKGAGSSIWPLKEKESVLLLVNAFAQFIKYRCIHRFSIILIRILVLLNAPLMSCLRVRF
jgi:hypothetical protein